MHNSIQDVVSRVTLSQPAGEKDPPKNDPTIIKTQLHQESQHKWHKGHPTASSSGYQGDYTTESYRSPTTEVHTTNSSSQKDQFKEAEANKKSLSNNGKTEKQPPVKRTGGILRKSAK